MKFVVIVWTEKESVFTDNGTIYVWCESMATALNTVTNLIQNKTFAHAVAMKML